MRRACHSDSKGLAHQWPQNRHSGMEVLFTMLREGGEGMKSGRRTEDRNAGVFGPTGRGDPAENPELRAALGRSLNACGERNSVKCTKRSPAGSTRAFEKVITDYRLLSFSRAEVPNQGEGGCVNQFCGNSELAR
jgi:hypothetical protein